MYKYLIVYHEALAQFLLVGRPAQVNKVSLDSFLIGDVHILKSE